VAAAVKRVRGHLLTVEGILAAVFSEESTIPDLAELARRSIEAPDPEGVLSFYAPDGVWDSTPWGMGTFHGKEAIRAFFEDWGSSYGHLEWKAEEVLELANEVTFAVIFQRGRIAESGAVELRYASVAQWRDGLIARNTTYRDVEEGRAAAERLATGAR
jgi:ketosteroid isomerase-like protein